MIVFNKPAGCYKLTKNHMNKQVPTRFEDENYPGGLWSG